MQILITGGTGLIGRHLIPRLLTLGHQVTVVTRNQPLGYHAKVGGFNSCQRNAALGVDIRLRHGLLRRSG